MQHTTSSEVSNDIQLLISLLNDEVEKTLETLLTELKSLPETH